MKFSLRQSDTEVDSFYFRILLLEKRGATTPGSSKNSPDPNISELVACSIKQPVITAENNM
jgi:hypothetical protein